MYSIRNPRWAAGNHSIQDGLPLPYQLLNAQAKPKLILLLIRATCLLNLFIFLEHAGATYLCINKKRETIKVLLHQEEHVRRKRLMARASMKVVTSMKVITYLSTIRRFECMGAAYS
jgi:hypothetical protein